MYDTLTKGLLVCRCWYSSKVISAAYGGHLMSKIPRAIRQGIKVVSCAEYKNNFLFERGFVFCFFKVDHLKAKHNWLCLRMGVFILRYPTYLTLMKCPVDSPPGWLTICAGVVPHTAAGSPWQKHRKIFKGELLNSIQNCQANSPYQHR